MHPRDGLAAANLVTVPAKKIRCTFLVKQRNSLSFRFDATSATTSLLRKSSIGA